MVAYGIGIIPLIKRLKVGFPDVTHPWYDDDAGVLGTFSDVELYFNSLKLFSPRRGYYPEPSKIILITHSCIIEAGKMFGLCNGF